MNTAPKGMRLHIALFGRRNVGKSSLLNAITRQSVSIVSEVAGTTTDPVEKAMELQPLGPVLFIDTAGIDDHGSVGTLRIERTRQVLDRTDLGIIVTDQGLWGAFEQEILETLQNRGVPVVVAFNKADLSVPARETIVRLTECKAYVVQTAADRGAGIAELRQAILAAAPAEFLDSPTIVRDLVGPGELVVLVVPIDKEAPKGRLILPQVQAIRDLLDGDAFCLVVKERELHCALRSLRRPPSLVVTDSQAFAAVAREVPPQVPLTSFSILFARFKGDLATMVQGALTIEQLNPGDPVLIAEACSHHPIVEDIGRVKLPRWLEQYVGGPLRFTHVQGHDFPRDLSPYRLVIHCGACMHGRREMLSRIVRCCEAGVPITNYGLVIAYSLGIFERALSPFPAVVQLWREQQAGTAVSASADKQA